MTKDMVLQKMHDKIQLWEDWMIKSDEGGPYEEAIKDLKEFRTMVEQMDD